MTTAVGAEAGRAKGDTQSLREFPQKAAPNVLARAVVGAVDDTAERRVVRRRRAR